MKTTSILAAFGLAFALAACSEGSFFEVEPPPGLLLKEQLQADESGDCPSCRTAPPSGEWPALEKEQLQDQDQDRADPCYGCRPLPPGGQHGPDSIRWLKEQLQGGEEEDRVLCVECSP